MYYVETSALVKLILEEAETPAMRRFLTPLAPTDLVTSALTRTEMLRAARRRGPCEEGKAREVLSGLSEITITRELLDTAGTLDPPVLRTLDAIHLVTAMEIEDELTAVVAYDVRLLDGAGRAGLPVYTPTDPRPPDRRSP